MQQRGGRGGGKEGELQMLDRAPKIHDKRDRNLHALSKISKALDHVPAVLFLYPQVLLCWHLPFLDSLFLRPGVNHC